MALRRFTKKEKTQMKLEPNPKNKWYKSKPMKFQVVDLEGQDWINFIVGGFYDGENYFEFKTLDEFTDYVLSSKHSLNIFAHFGGGYDFLFIIQNMLENNVEFESIIPRGSSILSFSIQGTFKRHTFRDSSAILPFSLKKITEAFNVETKKGDWDHSKTNGYTPELGEYLKSDCLGLYQSLKAYFESDLIKKSGPSTTIASQAQKILRTYLKKPIYGLNEQISELCRQACHGGRTEIFKPIGKNVIEYDINSLYPHVMKENYYPAGYAIGTKTFKKGKLGIYEVEVNAPDMHLPIIPCKQDKKLLFPVGQFRTTITSVEMEYAKKHGYEFKIIKGCYFTDKEKYFTDFITDLYKLRQGTEKNTVNNTLAKLIMNSSYGKFLIKPDKTNLIFDAEHGARHFRTIELKDKKVEMYERDVKLNSFSHAGIGAFILAYARILMHKKMEPLKEDIYYMDTDSCWTKANLNSSTLLGEFKLEKTYDEVCFLLPKTYIASSKDFKKIAMKGFDSRKIKGYTVEELKMVLAGELSIYVPHDKTIAKLKTALQKKQIVIHKKAFVKRILSKYDKRIVDLKLNVTKPIKLSLNPEINQV